MEKSFEYISSSFSGGGDVICISANDINVHLTESNVREFLMVEHYLLVRWVRGIFLVNKTIANNILEELNVYMLSKRKINERL